MPDNIDPKELLASVHESMNELKQIPSLFHNLFADINKSTKELSRELQRQNTALQTQRNLTKEATTQREKTIKQDKDLLGVNTDIGKSLLGTTKAGRELNQQFEKMVHHFQLLKTIFTSIITSKAVDFFKTGGFLGMLGPVGKTYADFTKYILKAGTSGGLTEEESLIQSGKELRQSFFEYFEKYVKEDFKNIITYLSNFTMPVKDISHFLYEIMKQSLKDMIPFLGFLMKGIGKKIISLIPSFIKDVSSFGLYIVKNSIKDVSLFVFHTISKMVDDIKNILPIDYIKSLFSKIKKFTEKSFDAFLLGSFHSATGYIEKIGKGIFGETGILSKFSAGMKKGKPIPGGPRGPGGTLPPALGTGGLFGGFEALGIGAVGATAILAAVAAAVIIFKKIASTFSDLEKSSANFRKNVGITWDYSKGLYLTAGSLVAEMGSVGVKTKNVYESMVAIQDVIGAGFGTRGVVGNIALMSAQLGISANTSAEFLKTMADTNSTTLDISKNLLFTVGNLSQAAGTNLDEVMKDIGKSASGSYNLLSRNPKELIKASIEARKFGSSLESLTKTAASVLDFTQSVNAEMNASVLLGKPLNLQRLRELSYTKDLRGEQEELNRLIAESRFNQLDPFQQQAFAAALGKSAKEVADIDESMREQLAMGKSIKEITDKQYETELRRKSNAQALTQISDTWSQIFYNLTPLLLQISEIFRSISSSIAYVVDSPFGKFLMRRTYHSLAELIPFYGDFQQVKRMFGGEEKETPTILRPQPGVSMNELSAATSPNVNVNIDQDTTHKKLDAVVASIDNLNNNLSRNGVSANVFIDSQKLDSATNRRLAFTGPLTPQPQFS